MSTYINRIKNTIQRQKLNPQKPNVLYNNFINSESPNNSSENTTSDDDDYNDNIIQAKRQMRIDSNMEKELKKYSESTRRSRSKSPGKRATRHGHKVVTISDVVEYKTMSPTRRKSPSPTKSYPKCDRRSIHFINGLITRPCRIQNSVFHTKEEWDEYMEIQLARIATTKNFLKENRDPNYKRPHTTKSRRRRSL